MPEPLEFTLKLGRSHVEHRLISLQRYRIHFPLGDKPFEVTEGERTFVTYVDNANRIRLNEFLKGHPEAQVGDFLVFRRDPVTGTWDIQLRQGARQAQLAPTPAQRVPRTAALTHQDIQATIAKLAPYYGMEAMQEYRGDIGTYDVIWKRVTAGHPAKVFEIQHRGNLDSAFVKLKHAYDLWNARLFLVTVGGGQPEGLPAPGEFLPRDAPVPDHRARLGSQRLRAGEGTLRRPRRGSEMTEV